MHPAATRSELPRRVRVRPTALRTMLRGYAAGREDREEPCGLLFGRASEDVVEIAMAVRLENAAPRPADTYRIDPDASLEATRRARSAGWALVGAWHGHLRGRPEPGRRDLAGLRQARHAMGTLAAEEPLLVIVGRGAGRFPVVRAWWPAHEEAREVPLRG